MAGSWGENTSAPDLWGSLFTVMHADWDDLNPLLERFDIDELVAWGLQTRSRARQYEAEGASSQEAAADPGPGPATTTSASSASSSGAPPGLGAAQAQQETPQVAAKKQGAPPAKSPTTGPPPVMGKPPQMSQAAKAFVKADPPPLKADPAAEQEGQRSRQCRGFATAQASRGPEAGLGESYADPGRVYVRRDSSTADSRGCDDAAMTSAPKAVVPSQVAVVELDNPPLPPPAPPTGTSSPPSKPMPQVTEGRFHPTGVYYKFAGGSGHSSGHNYSLALGPPGPLAAPQYAPVGLPAPGPQADVDSGAAFRDEPPPFTDVQSVRNIRCACPRVNRSGYRRVHEHHVCKQCHADVKRLSSSLT